MILFCKEKYGIKGKLIEIQITLLCRTSRGEEKTEVDFDFTVEDTNQRSRIETNIIMDDDSHVETSTIGWVQAAGDLAPAQCAPMKRAIARRVSVTLPGMWPSG